jgi:class 3 adenylate cyclase
MSKFNHIDSFKIWESLKSLNDLPKKKVSILFTDMVGSSIFWEKNESGMWNAIQLHEKQVKLLSKKHSGDIIKSIGDSWMIVFKGPNSLLNSLKFSNDLQKELKENPIKIGNKKVKIRIGISFGETWERKAYIQGNQTNDYLGPNVNAASRMESKLCDEGGIAWTIQDGDKIPKKVQDWLIEEEMDIHEIDFKMDCVNNRKRSARHFSDAQIHSCRSSKKLGGVEIVKAWKTI